MEDVVPHKMRGAPILGSPLGDWRLQHGGIAAKMLFISFGATLTTIF